MRLFFVVFFFAAIAACNNLNEKTILKTSASAVQDSDTIGRAPGGYLPNNFLTVLG